MELKPGYKHTEVGVIPERWKVKRLGELGRSYGGLTGKTKSDFGVGEDHYIPFLNVMNNVVIDINQIESVKVGPTESQNSVLIGDLFFNGSSETPEEVGMCAVLLDEVGSVYLNSFCFGFRFHPDAETSGLYLAYFFRSSEGRKLLYSLAQGATRYNLSKTVFLKQAFKIPEIGEQCAIATALSDVDVLIASLEKLIAKKRDLKQAAMQQLLTGQTRLPGFNGKWEVKRFGDFGICLRGVSYRGDYDLSPYDTENTIRLLRANNVQNTDLVTSNIQFVNKDRVSVEQVLLNDDVLICMANGSKDLVGKAARFDVADGHRYTFGAFMGCFRVIKGMACPSFVSLLFQTGRYRNYIANLIAGSSINNLKPTDIESLEFRAPDNVEQTAIATVLSDMDAELAAQEQRLAKTCALKQGMMQELLTGRTRLV